jgi:hypothetical protein
MREPDNGLLIASSRETIEQSAAALAPELKLGRWLNEANRYLTTYPAKEWVPGKGAEEDGELAAYMAATVPTHVVDGWAYLGRALHAQLRGDTDAATHLGYYAELRAALALLAAEGVGIFNRVQVAIDAEAVATPLSERDPPWGTHIAVWAILQHWGEQPDCVALLGKSIRYGDSALSEWLAAAGLESALNFVGIDLLRHWGLDLNRLARDREARHVASYQPTMLAQRDSPPAAESVAFVADVWEVLEPQSGSPFEVLDGHLVRLTLREAVSGLTEDEGAEEQARDPAELLAARVARACESLAIPEPRAGLIAEFIGASSDETTILARAAGSSDHGDREHHFEVLARSVLLLRLATGACRRMLIRAGIDADALAWWWQGLGTSRGLWSEPPETSDLLDQWVDVREAIEELEAEAGSERSRSELLDRLSGVLSRLAGAELVPIWSLPSARSDGD